MTEGSAINEALIRQLLLQENPSQKITNEAIEAASFLLMQFVVEARNRASVEVSLQTNWTFKILISLSTVHYTEHVRLTQWWNVYNFLQAEFDTDNHGSRSRQRTSVIGMSNSLSDDDNEDADGKMTIKSKHVLKVACELLMDFA